MEEQVASAWMDGRLPQAGAGISVGAATVASRADDLEARPEEGTHQIGVAYPCHAGQ